MILVQSNDERAHTAKTTDHITELPVTDAERAGNTEPCRQTTSDNAAFHIP